MTFNNYTVLVELLLLVVFDGPLLVLAILKEIPEAQHALPLLLFSVDFLDLFLESLQLDLFCARVRELIKIELLLFEDLIVVNCLLVIGRLNNKCWRQFVISRSVLFLNLGEALVHLLNLDRAGDDLILF